MKQFKIPGYSKYKVFNNSFYHYVITMILLPDLSICPSTLTTAPADFITDYHIYAKNQVISNDGKRNVLTAYKLLAFENHKPK